MTTGKAGAPIGRQVWAALENEVREALQEHLVGRRLVDFDGPHGPEWAALNLGTMDAKDVGPGIVAGLRSVLPLLEVRVPFSIERSSVEAAERGAPKLDADSATTAARTLADLEDRMIFLGLEAAYVRGLSAASSHPRFSMGPDAASCVDAVTQALLALDRAMVVGPYAVVLGDAPYRRLAASVSEYPTLRQLGELVGGPVVHSATLRGGLVMSQRGGDFRLSVGQDAAIGYASHDAERVALYLVESLTFSVSSPEAVVALEA